MQDIVAVAVPLALLLCGFVAWRVGRREAKSASPTDSAAGLALIAHGGLTLVNLANRGVSFMGRRVYGLGPRYWWMEALAEACLLVAVLTFTSGRVRAARSEGSALDGRDAKAFAGLVGGLVLLGLALELLRKADALPIQD